MGQLAMLCPHIDEVCSEANEVGGQRGHGTAGDAAYPVIGMICGEASDGVGAQESWDSRQCCAPGHQHDVWKGLQ